MNSLSALNTYSGSNVAFTVTTQVVERTVGESFVSPYLTWDAVRFLGELTGNGIQVSYNVSTVASTTVTFVNTGSANNPLTVTNPSTGVYVVAGILDVIDYIAAVAQINPPPGETGTVAYTATYTNTNTAAGNFVVAYTGTPV